RAGQPRSTRTLCPTRRSRTASARTRGGRSRRAGPYRERRPRGHSFDSNRWRRGAHPGGSRGVMTLPVGQVRDYLRGLQDRLCQAFETLDGSRFREDLWERPEGGGGRTRVLEGGSVFEKAGINFSQVRGTHLPPSATAQRPEL